MDSLILLFRMVLNYIVLYLTFRIIGKRELKGLNLFDGLIYLVIVGLATLSLVHLSTPYYLFLLPIVVLVIIQRGVIYFLLKRRDIEDLLHRKSIVLISHGEINYLAMRKYNVYIEDLLREMRKQGLRSLSQVDFVILENDRSLSIFPKEPNQPFVSPLPLVIGGELMKEHFHYVDIDELDFMTLLHHQGYDSVREVFYANYENDELFILAFDRPDNGQPLK